MRFRFSDHFIPLTNSKFCDRWHQILYFLLFIIYRRFVTWRLGEQKYKVKDLCLLDIEMSRENGITLTQRIKDVYCVASIIIVTSYDLPKCRKAADKN